MSRRKRKTLKQKKRKNQDERVFILKKKPKALLVINNKPIRRKAIAKCTHILKAYSKVKQEISQFDETDKPLFRLWLNATFGARLTEIRELQQEADELEDLIHLIHIVKYGRNISFHDAYNLVLELKKNPNKLEEELNKIRKKNQGYDPFNMDDDGEEEEDAEDDYVWEEDDDDFTDDFEGIGDDEDDLTDEDVEQLFLHFLSSKPRFEEILEDPRLYAKFFEEFKRSFFPGQEKEHTAPLFGDIDDDTRLKTLYRSLALKLHPDNAGADNGAGMELWYKVQEAYRQKDLEEMEKLNALQSYQQGSFSPDCPVSHILAVHADYKEQLKILRRGVRQSKKHIAWDFSKRKKKKDIHTIISNDISETIKEELLRKSYFENLIKKWAEAPKPRDEHTTRRRKRKKFVPPPEQFELPF